MPAARLAFLSLCVTLAAPASPGLGAEGLLLGKAFVVKDPSFGVVGPKRRVTAKGETSTGGFGILGDPAVDGALLTIETDTAAQTVALPAAGWRAVRNGFSYTD